MFSNQMSFKLFKKSLNEVDSGLDILRLIFCNKGRTIRKVMGGWGKNQKKIHARENTKKKNSCKEEGKEVQRVSPAKKIPAQAKSEKKIRAS